MENKHNASISNYSVLVLLKMKCYLHSDMRQRAVKGETTVWYDYSG